MSRPKSPTTNEYYTIIDKNYRYINASLSYLEGRNLKPKNIIGKKISDIWPDKLTQNHIQTQVDKALKGETIIDRNQFPFEGNRKWYRIKYSPVIDKNDSISNVIISTLDINDEIKHLKKLRQKLRIDGLTKTLNRRALEEDLKDKSHLNKKFYIMMLDLDNFKIVNDTLGHDAGDTALKIATKIFKETLGSRVKLYRLGGDEFIAIGRINKNSNPEEKASEIIKKIKGTIYNKKCGLCVSIGIAKIPKESKHSVKEILKIVDAKMYESKKNGKCQMTSDNLS